MIPASEFCLYHNIELSFIYSLNELGLIDITNIEENIFVPVSQLKHLEQLIRLKQEMDINIEGIETITYLLQRIKYMQLNIVQLTNRLSFYESWNKNFVSTLYCFAAFTQHTLFVFLPKLTGHQPASPDFLPVTDTSYSMKKNEELQIEIRANKIIKQLAYKICTGIIFRLPNNCNKHTSSIWINWYMNVTTFFL